jgi:hypothetical protein
MKNAVFWDVAPCHSYKNRRFGRRCRLSHQGGKNQSVRKTWAVRRVTSKRVSDSSIQLFPARGFLPDDGGDMFLRNVRCYKTDTALQPRSRISSSSTYLPVLTSKVHNFTRNTCSVTKLRSENFNMCAKLHGEGKAGRLEFNFFVTSSRLDQYILPNNLLPDIFRLQVFLNVRNRVPCSSEQIILLYRIWYSDNSDYELRSCGIQRHVLVFAELFYLNVVYYFACTSILMMEANSPSEMYYNF